MEFSSAGPGGHWRECVFFLDEPLHTCIGARATVTAMHDEATVRFEVQIDGQEVEVEVEVEEAADKGSRELAPEWDPAAEEDDDSRSDGSGTTTDSDDSDEEEEAPCLGSDRSRRWLLADSGRTDAIFSAVKASMDCERPAGLVVAVCGGSGLCIEAALRAGVSARAILGVEWTDQIAAEVSEHRRSADR